MSAEQTGAGVKQPGMSTGKKWLLGCGGCLGVLIVVAIALAVLGGFAFNAFKETSSKSANEIFGENYQPAGYTVMGMPIGQGQVKHFVLLTDIQRGILIFAVDSSVSEADARVLQSGDAKQVEGYLRRIAAQATGSAPGGSSQLKDIRFDEIKTVPLQNGKRLPMGNATVQTERRGSKMYSPAVVALVPLENSRLVALIAMDPRNNATDPKADFSFAQQTLRSELLRIVQDSSLDERLVSAGMRVHIPQPLVLALIH